MSCVAAFISILSCTPAAPSEQNNCSNCDIYNPQSIYDVNQLPDGLAATHPEIDSWTSGVPIVLNSNQTLCNENGCAIPTGTNEYCEFFTDQNLPQAAAMSGFLVADNRVLTAGHGVPEDAEEQQEWCKNTTFVFDYDAARATQISPDNLYDCSSVLYTNARWDSIGTTTETDDIPVNDWALIELDRKTVGRHVFEKFTPPNSLNPLAMIGFPLGLPMKITTGQLINESENHFVTDLDSMRGNSGSVVIDLQTGAAVGLHVGASHRLYQSVFDPQRGCHALERCDGVDQGDPACRGSLELRAAPLVDRIADFATENAPNVTPQPPP